MTDTILLKVKEVIKETVDTITIVFEKASTEITYQSGQFLTLIATINGEEIRRAYSLCSTSGVDENLAVSVKRVDGGKMSNYLNDNLKKGDELSALAPMGNFVFSPSQDRQRHIVLIGAGSGITPLMSILKAVLKQESKSIVSLVYTNKNQENAIFYKQLEELKSASSGRLRLVHHFTRRVEEVQKKGFLGLKKKLQAEEVHYRLTREQLSLYLDLFNIEPTDDTQYYVCGPNGMMDIAEITLKNRKVVPATIHLESFVSNKEDEYKNKNQNDNGVKSVELIVSGQNYHVDVKGSETILQAAISQGVEIPYSCQAGICTACMGKCTSGDVEMSEDMGLTDGEKAEGQVLTCVSHPVSNNVVIEYD